MDDLPVAIVSNELKEKITSFVKFHNEVVVEKLFLIKNFSNKKFLFNLEQK